VGAGVAATAVDNDVTVTITAIDDSENQILATQVFG